MLACRLLLCRRGTLAFAILACMMGAASLTLLDNADDLGRTAHASLRYRIIGGALLFLVCMNAGRLQVLTRWPKHSRIMLFWMLFAVSWLASAFFYLDSVDIVSGLWLTLGVPCVFFAMLPCTHSNLAQMAVYAYLASQLPYVIMSLLYCPIVVPYQGIFPGPNQLGVTTAAMAACMLVIFYSCIRRKARLMRIAIAIALTAGLVMLTLLSRSRTALTALVLAHVVVSGALLYGKNARNKLVPFLLLSLLVPFVPFRGKALGVYVCEKHVTRTSLVTGRRSIWLPVLADTTVVGHGKYYFATVVGHGSHNSIVEALGKHGLVAAIALLGVAITSVFGALRFALRQRYCDPYALAPLVIIVTFWAMAMTEGMFGAVGKGMTLLMFVNIGIVMSPRCQGIDRFMLGTMAENHYNALSEQHARISASPHLSTETS